MEEEHGKGPAKASGDDEASSGDDYDAGTRPHPYYGCTFCRRGFSNAQALGGHMNIHRKDRAKAQPQPQPQPPPPPPAVSSSAGYAMHSPLAPSAERTTARHLIFGQDLRLGLSSSTTGGYRRHRDAAPGAVTPPGGETRRQQEVDEDYCEVDLELRLGQQPHDERHSV